MSWIAIVMALLHACAAEHTLRRKRTTVLAIDDLQDKPTTLDEKNNAWGRALKGSKKGKKGNGDSTEEEDSEEEEDSADVADSTDDGKDAKKGSKKKGSKKTKKGAKKGKKGGTVHKAGSVKIGSHLIDSFMDEINFALSFSMSMSMPSPSAPGSPSTPAPVSPSTPAPVTTAEPTSAPVALTVAPQIATDPPLVTPTLSPTISPLSVCESLPREEAMESILVETTDGPILSDPSTPQGMAYRWILNDDPLQIDPCTYPTVQSRYALATFYFSTGGDNWIVNTGWLSVAGECDSFGITCVDGKITSITMGTFA
jgi:hypothetical protein